MYHDTKDSKQERKKEWIFKWLSSKESLCNAGDAWDMGQSLGWEDALGIGNSTHSRILAWKISWTEEPDRLQSMELQRVGHDWAHKHITSSHIITWIYNKFEKEISP